MDEFLMLNGWIRYWIQVSACGCETQSHTPEAAEIPFGHKKAWISSVLLLFGIYSRQI